MCLGYYSIFIVVIVDSTYVFRRVFLLKLANMLLANQWVECGARTHETELQEVKNITCDYEKINISIFIIWGYLKPSLAGFWQDLTSIKHIV